MVVSAAVPTVSRRSEAARRSFARVVLTAAAALGTLYVPTRTSEAQAVAPPPRAWELRVTGGALVPTGSQRNVLKDAQATAAQLSWLVRPQIVGPGESATRNDVVVMVGMRVDRHRAESRDPHLVR